MHVVFVPRVVELYEHVFGFVVDAGEFWDGCYGCVMASSTTVIHGILILILDHMSR